VDKCICKFYVFLSSSLCVCCRCVRIMSNTRNLLFPVHCRDKHHPINSAQKTVLIVSKFYCFWQVNIGGTVKGKFPPLINLLNTMTYMREGKSSSTAPHGSEWSDSLYCFTHRERVPHTNWIEGWAGPRVGLHAVEKRKILLWRENN
jgi:hypothetical protein